MAGVAIASPANDPTPNGPNVVPCDKPGEHCFGLRADLRPPTYGHLPIQWGAQRAWMVTTMAMISGLPAQVTAAPRPGCHASARIVVT